jgi:outer membrane protein assembly factor BamB
MTTLIYSEDSWPTWRGPQANGVAPKTAQPPTKWDEKNNIKWKIPLSGKGSATPIVWGDQIFVVTATKTDRLAKPEELPKIDPTFQTKTTPPNHFYRFEVFCYDRHTGKEIWKQLANEAIPHEGHHETHSYAAGSPTTDGKRLYVSFGSFGIYAYDLSGKLLWRRDLGRIHSRLGWGEAVTPVVYGDSLILNWDQEANSKLIVLDASTGKTKWEAQRDEKTSWNTPFVVDHQGQTQVIINGTNRIRSYDLKEGKVLWEVGGMTVNAIPSPLVSEGVAYIMSGYRGAAAVAVPLNSKGELKENQVLWRHGKGTPYVPSPILYEGRLYFTAANTPVLTVLDAKTGKVLLEGERLPKLSSFYSSPMIAGGHLYLADRNGTTAVLTLGDKPEVVSLNKLDDSFDASPVTVGKTLYLRGEKYLYAIEEKK